MLDNQIKRKLKRLENTITCTNNILKEINTNIQIYNKKNKKLILLANVYQRWKQKIRNAEENKN